jgi:hypothetical protein
MHILFQEALRFGTAVALLFLAAGLTAKSEVAVV